MRLPGSDTASWSLPFEFIISVDMLLVCITLLPRQFGVLRMYSRPPRMSGLIIQVVLRLLPLSLIAHLIVASMVYSRTDLVPSTRASLGDYSATISYHNLLDRGKEALATQPALVASFASLHSMTVLLVTALLAVVVGGVILHATVGRAVMVLLHRVIALLMCRGRLSDRQLAVLQQVCLR
jgi:hypothetical protein